MDTSNVETKEFHASIALDSLVKDEQFEDRIKFCKVRIRRHIHNQAEREGYTIDSVTVTHWPADPNSANPVVRSTDIVRGYALGHK